MIKYRYAFASVLFVALFSAAQPSLARPFSQTHSDQTVTPVAMTSGVVLVNGEIAAGQNFHVTRPAKSEYVLQFSSGLFAEMPAFSCTPMGPTTKPAPICVIESVQWVNSTSAASVEFHFFSSPNVELVNSAFMFTEITTKTTD